MKNKEVSWKKLIFIISIACLLSFVTFLIIYNFTINNIPKNFLIENEELPIIVSLPFAAFIFIIFGFVLKGYNFQNK